MDGNERSLLAELSKMRIRLVKREYLQIFCWKIWMNVEGQLIDVKIFDIYHHFEITNWHMVSDAILKSLLNVFCFFRFNFVFISYI